MIDDLRRESDSVAEPNQHKIQQDTDGAFRAHWKEIRNYLKRRAFDDDAAEDLAQEVFLHFSTYGHPVMDVRAFLFRTARNLLSNWIRDRNRKKTVTILSAIRDSEGMTIIPGNEPLDTRESEPQAAAIQREQALMVLALSKECLCAAEHDAIEATYLTGNSPKEASLQHGHTRTAVRKNLSRAIIKLQKVMAGEG